MKMKKEFTVSYPKWMYRLALSAGIFILLAPILPAVLGGIGHIAWYICFGLLSLPELIGAVCFRRFRVTVLGSSIKVRKGLGVNVSFDVSEITGIEWKKINSGAGRLQAIKISTCAKRVTVENSMDGYEELAEYILSNVGSSKITYYIDGDKGAHYVCIAGAVAIGVFGVFAKLAEYAVFEKAGWSFDDVLFFVPYLAVMAGFLGVGHKIKRKVKVGKFDAKTNQMEIMCSGRAVRFWRSPVSGEGILCVEGTGQIPQKEQKSMEAVAREVIDAYANLRLR